MGGARFRPSTEITETMIITKMVVVIARVIVIVIVLVSTSTRY